MAKEADFEKQSENSCVVVVEFIRAGSSAWTEQGTSNPQVEGSNPSRSARIYDYPERGEKMRKFRLATYRYMHWRESGWTCGVTFGIEQRSMLFWWKPLCHVKIVSYGSGKIIQSYKILTFTNKEDAVAELERLEYGAPPIQRRYYSKGIFVGESRYNWPDGQLYHKGLKTI